MVVLCKLYSCIVPRFSRGLDLIYVQIRFQIQLPFVCVLVFYVEFWDFRFDFCIFSEFTGY